MRDRIKAMFQGVAIGDALGLPFECRYDDYGYITEYVMKKPLISDDTQLTAAVAAAMIDVGGIEMESQKKRHIEAYNTSTFGWGRGTTYSIGKLLNPDLRPPTNRKLGSGNGVAMKFSPIGAFLATVDDTVPYLESIAELALFTHPSSLGVSQGFVQAAAVCHCLRYDTLDKDLFVELICMVSDLGRTYCIDDCDNLTDRLAKVLTVEDPKKEFDGGSPYVYNSLPFAYHYFLKNPYSIESLYEVASAGGDVDSNASIVGALLGALNGTKIFPEHLLELPILKDINEIADAFCNKFGVK